MKSKLLFWVGVVSFLTVSPAGVFGAGSRDRVKTIQAAPSAAPSSGGSRMSVQWGLGVAGASYVTRTSTAFSTWTGLGENGAIQGYVAIASSDPFAAGLGAIYKHTVVGTQKAGFHLGGGLGLGSVSGGSASVSQILSGSSVSGSTFFVQISFDAGVHFRVPGVESLLISADAGAGLGIINGNASFTVGGFSDVLGLSIHYLL